MERKQPASQIPEMFASMPDIDDMKGAGKVSLGDIPDPIGAIAKNHLFVRSAPAALPGFGVEAPAKLLGLFDGSD